LFVQGAGIGAVYGEYGEVSVRSAFHETILVVRANR
jgi:hypothetical protein